MTRAPSIRTEASEALPVVRPLFRGAIAGLVLGALVQGTAAVAAYLLAGQDRASSRAASAVDALGAERGTFLLQMTALVALVTASIGATQAFFRLVARNPSRGEPRHVVVELGLDLAWTGALASVLVLGRASAAPALLGPSLPLPSALAGWLAVHVRPGVFYAVPALAYAFAVGRALRFGRRRTAVVALGAVLVLGCGVAFALWIGGRPRTRAHEPRAAKAKPNVLVLAADSVRPDHLSGFGYARPTTPNLDRLAAEGAVFERTIAPLAMTTPSWTSILSGRYPHGHGIRHMFPDRRLRPRSLDALPKVATEQGYRTSVVSDYAGDFFPIFDFGFARVHTSPPLNTRTLFQREVVLRSPLALAFLEPLPELFRPSIFRYLMNAADAERLADEVLSELDDPSDAPFFIVAFFSTTHVPFAPRYPYDLRFTSSDYTGEHRFAYNLSSIADLTRAERPVTDADARQLVGLYDGALASVDAGVGRILAGLAERGLDRETIVVFLSDHGENLFEPGQTTLHGKWFRGGDEANRVPLILRGPGIDAGIRVAQPVSLVDVAPTLAELLSLRPLDRADGRSLAPALRGTALPSRPVFAETGAWLTGRPDDQSIPTPPLSELLEADPTDDGQLILKPKYEDVVTLAKHRALWDGALKLVYEPGPSGAAFSLFDLASDPKQERDLINTPAASPLISAMWRWLGRDPEREVDAVGHVVRRAD